ncbi:hypothetical protein BKA62DRAFT_775594 [Auriculariales sp. MPI-PUGE-AT-0066]|nr:hypothetical protein BKA62DRAFT_775594 [Auriculariales sp. MPI-PUGE-AT-0066]
MISHAANSRVSFRAPHRPRSRYTVAGVSSAELRSLAPIAEAPTETNSNNTVRSNRHIRALHDVEDSEADNEDELMDDGDLGDAAADKDVADGADLAILAEELKALRLELKDDGPEFGGPKIKHSDYDCNLLYVIRTVVQEVLGIHTVTGPKHTKVYSGFADHPTIAVAWLLPMKHPFNRRATELLAEKVINHPMWAHLFKRVTDATRHGIALGIHNHLKYLAKIYNQLGWARLQVTEEQKRAQLMLESLKRCSVNADERRRTLHRWRIDTCIYYDRPDWVALLQHATALCMSSDDPSSSNEYRPYPERIYYVTVKDWRHPDFIQFLRILDRCGRVREGRTKTKGRWLRRRFHRAPGHEPRESAREPPSRLAQQMYTSAQRQRFGHFHRYAQVNILSLEQALIDITALAISIRADIEDI